MRKPILLQLVPTQVFGTGNAVRTQGVFPPLHFGRISVLAVAACKSLAVGKVPECSITAHLSLLISVVTLFGHNGTKFSQVILREFLTNYSLKLTLHTAHFEETATNPPPNP